MIYSLLTNCSLVQTSLQSLAEKIVGLQDLSGLLSNPRAAYASFALDMLGWVILLPCGMTAPSRNPEHEFMMRNKKICHQMLKLNAVMEGLIAFLMRNSKRNPQFDIEWVAVKGRILLMDLRATVEGSHWIFEFLPEDRYVLPNMSCRTLLRKISLIRLLIAFCSVGEPRSNI